MDDHHYAERRAVDPGRDAGIGRGGPGGRRDRLGASSDLRFEAASLGGPAVGAAGQRRAGDRRAILGPTHRTEPGAAPPADRPVGPERANPGPSRPPASLSLPLHPPRHRLAGRCRCGAGRAVRAGPAAHLAAGRSGLRQNRVPAAGGDLRLAHLQSAPLGGLPAAAGPDAPHPGTAGLDHIPAVDAVTPWQGVGAVETISERHWLPVLEAIRPPFPLRILGFPCDNGPEFLHPTVARLLHKLLVEFPQSRRPLPDHRQRPGGGPEGGCGAPA